jgi:hypothetical protein
MINYHILTYMTPEAFIEDDVIVAPQLFVVDEDSWQHSLFFEPLAKITLWMDGNENSILIPPTPPRHSVADEDYCQRRIRVSDRRIYGRGGSIPPIPPKRLLHIDEETWQHRLFVNLKWRVSLWFSSDK